MDTNERSPISPPSLHSFDKNSSGSKRASYDINNVEKLSAAAKGSSDESSATQVSEAEKKLVKKLDRRIMPIICLVYLFACE
jgi:hypothetical protein